MKRIVDAHHHLWDLGAVHYPWLMAKGVARFFGDPTPIQRNYLVDEFRRDAKDYIIEASVHIQVGAADGEALNETRWLQERGDADGLPTAIVAFCDLSRRDAPAQLDAQREFERLRGIRQIVGRSDAEDAVSGSGALLDMREWRNNLALLPTYDLSFDLQLVPSQVPKIVRILEAIPDLRVALCHCGSPWDQSAGGIRNWREGLSALAALPEVCCKISGFGMFDHGWTVESIRPLVESCVEIFGAGRCMFGSNFPVDKLHADYTRLWGAYDWITASCSDDERARLFGGTAREFYRLP